MVVLVQGYIRFSFLGRGDTKISKTFEADEKSARERLYDSARMEQRFHLFKRLCLPSLRAQTDPDFHVAVLVSGRMPKRFKVRLAAMIAPLPQLRIHYSRATDVQLAARSALKDLVGGYTKNSVHFRLDDDDAVGKDFIANLKSLAAHVQPETLITQPRGCTVFCHEGAPYVEPQSSMFHSVGWARVNAPGDIRTPFKFGHVRAATRFAAISDPRPMSHAYLRHAASDTDEQNQRDILKLVQSSIQGAGKARLRAFRAEVDAAFPSIGVAGMIDAITSVPRRPPLPMQAAERPRRATPQPLPPGAAGPAAATALHAAE